MAEFQVTASTLKQKAEELSTLNNNFAKKVEELMASEKSLSGMWEGQAKEAFENAFNTDAGKMNQFKAAVDEYYSRLLTIVSQYEQAESKNVSVGTTRTAVSYTHLTLPTILLV